MQTIPTHILDIRQDICPQTFVKVKLLLEKMEPGEMAMVVLSAGEAVENLPKSLPEIGGKVLSMKHDEKENSYYMVITKEGSSKGDSEKGTVSYI